VSVTLSGGCSAPSAHILQGTPCHRVCFFLPPPDQQVLRAGAFLWSDLGFVGVSQAQDPEDVTAKQDRRAVSATWLPSFALVTLVLFMIVVGGASASKLRSWRMYPNINSWAVGKPSPRVGHKMVAGSDGALWVFGELYCRDCGSSSDLFKLDLGAKEWTKITTSGVSPVARNSHTMTSTDGFLWVHGGNTGSGIIGEVRKLAHTNTVQASCSVPVCL
jgi:hypothetical protein